MAATLKFRFDDAASFRANLRAYSDEVTNLHATLGPVLAASLPDLASSRADKPTLLTTLHAALAVRENAEGTAAAGVQLSTGDSAGAGSVEDNDTPSSESDTRTAANRGWFLHRIEIEGFRGINNEGFPLGITLRDDRINSISAPNGVGKSSIYDALTFAITGGIPKLDNLLQSERAAEYYLNRFHPGTAGTIELTLSPDDGAPAVVVTVTRSSDGKRTVTASGGADGESLLSELNREFVLLDAHTFHTFIDERALDRGRSFAGLLGLAQYSELRQELQGLANTRAFNSHFDVTGRASRKAAADRAASNAQQAIKADYESLVGKPLEPDRSDPDAQADCHAALHGIPLLNDHCADQPFLALDVDACIETIKDAEGGIKRDRLAELVRLESTWMTANKELPSDTDLPLLAVHARSRADALNKTAGDLLNKLYRLGEQVLTSPEWSSQALCPLCERDDGSSVLDKVHGKLSEYDAVETATMAAATEWGLKGWGDLLDLEALALDTSETPRFKQLAKAGAAGTLTVDEAEEVAALVQNFRGRADKRLDDIRTEKEALERELPPSLVAVTTAVETVRRLQKSWNELAEAQAESASEGARALRVQSLKLFLDQAATTYADAEAHIGKERLSKVEPVCRSIFKDIMFAPVVPTLKKREGGEELGIELAEFWNLKNVSAQALLSESFRNAFAISVYLAAASLYGGAPRFMVLDDVTSSFDAGHQQHLVEVIRTRFARPLTPSGPQVIFLTHDTLLEKLFNRLSNTPEWAHQRLEGTARTAVLPQAGAANKVRDATIEMLNAGRIDDAAPRIRQFLEYTLHQVIDRLRIPVPMDLAFGDEKRTAGEYLKAINAAVALHEKAGDLVLDAGQKTALGLHSSTITGNYLAHWSTGQSQAFSAPALLGVMAAIEAFPDSFKHQPSASEPKRFYRSLNQVSG
jgi:hypothetical protein